MEAASINIAKQRGLIVVQAIGRTPRGQRYIKGSIPLTCKTIKDPKFKEEMKRAVDELLGRTS